jgi:hypothetical protein
LDLVVTIQLYHLAENLPPGEMTMWRSAIVCNEVIGFALARLGLDRLIRHNSSALKDDVSCFTSSVDINCPLEKILYGSSVPPPKVLGDVFEAILGAIYIDSGGNLDTIKSFVSRNLLKVYFDEAYSASKGRKWGIHVNPIAMISEAIDILSCKNWKMESSQDGCMSCFCIQVHDMRAEVRAANKLVAKKQASTLLLNGDPNRFWEKFSSVCNCKGY